MTHTATVDVTVGKGEDAKTIPAGQPLTGLPSSEIERLRGLGALGPDAPPPGTETQIEGEASDPDKTGLGVLHAQQEAARKAAAEAEKATREQQEAAAAAAAKKAADEESARRIEAEKAAARKR